MKASYLARWTTPSATAIPAYQILYSIDERFDGAGALGGDFINISAEVAGDYVYLFGTGVYRASPIPLARKRLATLDTPGGFERIDAATATWSATGGAPIRSSSRQRAARPTTTARACSSSTAIAPGSTARTCYPARTTTGRRSSSRTRCRASRRTTSRCSRRRSFSPRQPQDNSVFTMAYFRHGGGQETQAARDGRPARQRRRAQHDHARGDPGVRGEGHSQRRRRGPARGGAGLAPHVLPVLQEQGRCRARDVHARHVEPARVMPARDREGPRPDQPICVLFCFFFV